MGTLPPTKLLLLHHDIKVGIFDKYSDIFWFLGGYVSPTTGEIIILGQKSSVTYMMDQYTVAEAAADFAKTTMHRYLDDYSIYRFLSR